MTGNDLRAGDEPTGATGPADFSGFLHAVDGKLLDGSGRHRLLRGVGLGNWLLAEGYMWGFPGTAPQSPREIETFVADLVGSAAADDFWTRFRDVFVTESDIARIAAEGFDHVRLPLNSRFLLAPDGDVDADALGLVDRLVGWCRRHRLWVVLDLHGAPGGQTGTNIDDSLGHPALFTDRGHQESTVMIWTRLARHYRDEPVIAGYDLLNEPLPDEHQHTYVAELVQLYLELTEAIREVDPHHLLIYEGTHWATNWTLFDRVWDPNSMLQFHKYWSPPDRASIEPFLRKRSELRLPIYMGEGGENNHEWIQTAFQLYEDHDISWNFWPWKKVSTRTSPASIDPPDGWDLLVQRAAGEAAAALDAATAREILDNLLDNARLDRCSYRGELVNALLRRAPVELSATGFGFRAGDSSFHQTESRGVGYRHDDGARVEHSSTEINWHHTDGRERSPAERLSLSLQPGERVTYAVEVSHPAALLIRVDLTTNEPTDDPLDLEVDGDLVARREPLTASVTWATSRLRPGWHRLRLVARDPCSVHGVKVELLRTPASEQGTWR